MAGGLIHRIFCYLEVLIFGACLVCGTFVSSSEVKDLADEYFDFKIREDPWFATKLGIDKYQDKVQEWNHESFNRRIRESEALKTRADKFLSDGKFESDQDKIGLKIMSYSLDTYIKGAAFRNYTVTLNEDLADLGSFLRQHPVTTMEQLGNWYSRVIALQTVFADQLVLLDQAIMTGLTKTQYIVEGLIERHRTNIGDSTETFFASQPWITLNIETENSTFYEDGLRECGILRERMITYADKLENEYKPVARDSDHEGVINLPGGEQFYRNTLRYYTHNNATPEHVHQIGLDESKRITDEMKRIVAKQGFNGTVREYTTHLLSQEGQTFSTSEELLQAYKDNLKNRIEPQMEKEFDPPSTGIEVDIVDDPWGSIGRYRNPVLNTETGEYGPGQFVYDGSKPEGILKLNMLPLLLHESIPGHHYQISYNLLVYPLPDYLRHYSYAHYSQDGFKFPTFTANVEGWGLYSEYLGSQGMLDVIETDAERLGQLSFESLRAARLVVDTGMHFYNWTRTRAEDFLKESTTLSDEACVGQIKRYIDWPGQATAYKIGELKIKELRKTAEEKLGEDFDPKGFHKVIMELGPAPLEIMEDQVMAWIDSGITSEAGRPGSSQTLLMISMFILAAFSFVFNI